MSGKVIKDILVPGVVTLGKYRGFKSVGFLDGSILLAKGTGPENIIKWTYI